MQQYILGVLTGVVMLLAAEHLVELHASVVAAGASISTGGTTYEPGYDYQFEYDTESFDIPEQKGEGYV